METSEALAQFVCGEAAQLVVAGSQDGVTEDGSDATLPSWFMVEVVRDLPRLAVARAGS